VSIRVRTACALVVGKGFYPVLLCGSFSWRHPRDALVTNTLPWRTRWADEAVHGRHRQRTTSAGSRRPIDWHWTQRGRQNEKQNGFCPYLFVGLFFALLSRERI
jgi:hypothetical protein